MARILYAVGTAYLPEDISGANINVDALCRRLAARGHEPMVLCAKVGRAAFDPPDYEVEHHSDPIRALPDLVNRVRPDAVVIRGPGPAAQLLAAGGVPGHTIHIHFESAFWTRGFPSPRERPDLRYAVSSPFMKRVADSYFAEPVSLVEPIIEPERFRVRRRGDAVLFVNPVAIKGAYIAAAIAAKLPERRFLFVRNWPNRERHPHIAPRLPNVEWLEPRSDMRPIYARARALLVPSVWEEASGRVVTEAQLSGIPVIAADRGGLRDTVGPGGIVLPVEAPTRAWADAVEAMFTDAPRYAALSAAARAHARRPETNPELCVDAFLTFCGLAPGPGQPRRRVSGQS